MTAAHLPIQRPPQAKLLVVDKLGRFQHETRARLARLFRSGDLAVANDAATLPASLAGIHIASGLSIEARLAGRRSLAAGGVCEMTAVIFGAGDYRMRTEDRPLPPQLAAGDRLVFGPLHATVKATLGHPRLALLVFEGSPHQVWEGIARHGRPIQYSHVRTPLALWDLWTPIAGPPVAFEAPSAGFALNWDTLSGMRESGVRFATLTHAAGISSTGDPELDARLPFDEPYSIPLSTALAIRQARARQGRVIAIGTTVVRALEGAAGPDGLVATGEGVATQRIGRASRLRAVDAILSGTHEPGASHHELLRAFVDEETLERVDRELDLHGYRTHEFGDSVFVERMDSGGAGFQRPAVFETARHVETRLAGPGPEPVLCQAVLGCHAPQFGAHPGKSRIKERAGSGETFIVEIFSNSATMVVQQSLSLSMRRARFISWPSSWSSSITFRTAGDGFESARRNSATAAATLREFSRFSSMASPLYCSAPSWMAGAMARKASGETRVSCESSK